MSIQVILPPIADGGFTGSGALGPNSSPSWSGNNGWQNVNYSPNQPVQTTTKIANNNNGGGIVYFVMQPTNIPKGSRINGVWQACATTRSAVTQYMYLKVNDVVYSHIYNNLYYPANTTVWITWRWFRDPVTGGRWTPERVNAIQAAGWAAYNNNPIYYGVALIVDYDPPETWSEPYSASPVCILPMDDADFIYSHNWGGNFPTVKSASLISEVPGAPDDTSYCSVTNFGEYNYWTFNYPKLPPTAKNITVRLIQRWNGVGAAGVVRPGCLKIGNTQYNNLGANVAILAANAYNNYIWDYTINPATYLPWTIDDINGLSNTPLSYFGGWQVSHGGAGMRMSQACILIFFDTVRTLVNYGNKHTMTAVSSTPGNGNIIMLPKPIIPQNGNILMMPVNGNNVKEDESGKFNYRGFTNLVFGSGFGGQQPHGTLIQQKEGKQLLVDLTGGS
jgi:hypothetical protein